MTSEYEFKEFPDYVPDDGITAAELVSGKSTKIFFHTILFIILKILSMDLGLLTSEFLGRI